jgi:hypothetical protein
VRETTDGAVRSQRAFDLAVARERDAIKLHERAAELHDATAQLLLEAALGEPDQVRSDAMRRRAAAERGFALTARGRARTVRERLAAEGISDTG